MSRKNHARNLLLCLVVSQLSRPLADILTPDGWQWQAHDLFMHASVCMLVVLLVKSIPFHRVAAKCIAVAWLGFEIIPFLESALKFRRIDLPIYPMVAQGVLASAMAMWYWLRAPSALGDVLDDTHLFICRLKPRSVQDILLAMCGRAPLGGVAIYFSGRLWHFSRGELVCTNFEQARRYVAKRAGTPAASTIKTLDHMIGSKWQIHRNCITMLYATAVWGRPLFHKIF